MVELDRVKGPVILKGDISSAIENGAWIEVKCVEPAERYGNTHRGIWNIFVCEASNDDVVRAMYVKGRGLQPRNFVTVAGLMSLSIELGMNTFVCPIFEGQTEVWEFDTSNVPSQLPRSYAEPLSDDSSGGSVGASEC